MMLSYLLVEHQLNSFQQVVHKYEIDSELIDHFMKSMRADLNKQEYNSIKEYEAYIYGSADVVGLMCLKVFVGGDSEKYDSLKESAMRLGSAFQKVNFLRDLKADFDELNRSYFPNVDLNKLDESSKQKIIDDIENDFENENQQDWNVTVSFSNSYNYNYSNVSDIEALSLTYGNPVIHFEYFD